MSLVPDQYQYQPRQPNRPWPVGRAMESRRDRSINTGLIAFLLVLSVLGTVGYGLLKFWPPASGTDAKAAPAQAEMPMSEAEDYTRHLEAAESDSLRAAEEMKRAQEWMERVTPGLEQNYLAAEKRRLDAAFTASEAARRAVQQAREELEIIKSLLIERSKPKP